MPSFLEPMACIHCEAAAACRAGLRASRIPGASLCGGRCGPGVVGGRSNGLDTDQELRVRREVGVLQSGPKKGHQPGGMPH